MLAIDETHPAVAAAAAASVLAESAASIAKDPDTFDATAVSSQLSEFVSSTFAAAGESIAPLLTLLAFNLLWQPILRMCDTEKNDTQTTNLSRQTNWL